MYGRNDDSVSAQQTQQLCTLGNLPMMARNEAVMFENDGRQNAWGASCINKH
jgi:hypothetical protein